MDPHNACREHLDLVLEAAGFALWENDLADGRVIRPVSKVFQELGYLPGEFPTTVDAMLSIIHPDDIEALRLALDAHIAGTAAHYRAEFRIRAKSGEWVWYENYGRIVDRTDTSRGRRLVGVSINVNERKLREREIERLNAQLVERNGVLQQLATSDALTGVANRRSLLELGEVEVRRARRLGHALSLLILDINDFKEVYDAWRHLGGDHVIRCVGTTCAQNVRVNVDVAGRLGGEEFAVVLPEVPEERALVLAERLRSLIASRNVELDGSVVVGRTVSIGVASLTADCDSLVNMVANGQVGGGRSPSDP